MKKAEFSAFNRALDILVDLQANVDNDNLDNAVETLFDALHDFAVDAYLNTDLTVPTNKGKTNA
jgi:hypothetical protein